MECEDPWWLVRCSVSLSLSSFSLMRTLLSPLLHRLSRLVAEGCCCLHEGGEGRGGDAGGDWWGQWGCSSFPPFPSSPGHYEIVDWSGITSWHREDGRKGRWDAQPCSYRRHVSGGGGSLPTGHVTTAGGPASLRPSSPTPKGGGGKGQSYQRWCFHTHVTPRLSCLPLLPPTNQSAWWEPLIAIQFREGIFSGCTLTGLWSFWHQTDRCDQTYATHVTNILYIIYINKHNL